MLHCHKDAVISFLYKTHKLCGVGGGGLMDIGPYQLDNSNGSIKIGQ